MLAKIISWFRLDIRILPSVLLCTTYFLYRIFFFTMKNMYLIVNLCVELWAEAANSVVFEIWIYFPLFRNLDMAETAVKVMRASMCLRALCGHRVWFRSTTVGPWCLDPSARGPWKALEDSQVQQLYFARGSRTQRRKVLCRHRSMGLNHFPLSFSVVQNRGTLFRLIVF